MLAPEKITLYCRSKDKDGVYHAFPVDSSNNNHDTAKSWATVQERHWDSESRKYVYGERTEPTKFEFVNQGFKNVMIESLDIRGEGGRAYQVILNIDDTKFRVDLREDTLMDVIKNTGIRLGGWLNGSFCFAKDGSQTKLIREGTELHKRAIAEREKREIFSKTIKRSDLKSGYKYTTLSGHSAIFLGFVYTYDIDDETGVISKPYKALLFVKDSEYARKLITTGIVEYNESGTYRKVSTYSFELVKSHSYKIEGEKVLNNDLNKYVANINTFAAAMYKENMETKNYSRYTSDFVTPLKLATMAVDKKDIHVDKDEGKKIFRKINDYYNRW